MNKPKQFKIYLNKHNTQTCLYEVSSNPNDIYSGRIIFQEDILLLNYLMIGYFVALKDNGIEYNVETIEIEADDIMYELVFGDMGVMDGNND